MATKPPSPTSATSRCRPAAPSPEPAHDASIMSLQPSSALPVSPCCRASPCCRRVHAADLSRAVEIVEAALPSATAAKARARARYSAPGRPACELRERQLADYKSGQAQERHHAGDGLRPRPRDAPAGHVFRVQGDARMRSPTPSSRRWAASAHNRGNPFSASPPVPNCHGAAMPRHRPPAAPGRPARAVRGEPAQAFSSASAPTTTRYAHHRLQAQRAGAEGGGVPHQRTTVQ